jgi:hypothetical protein
MKVKAWSATLIDNVRVVKVNASTSPPAKVTVMRGNGLRNAQVSKEFHYRVKRGLQTLAYPRGSDWFIESCGS